MTRHWLMPDDRGLIPMLREQATITVEGMHALAAWAAGAREAADTVRACEHRADDTKRALWRALRESFAPPFDAEDLFELSTDLDEVLNGAKDLVREMEVMNLAPDEPMATMADLLSRAVEELDLAFAGLGVRGDDPTVHADAAIKSQRRVEHTYRTAMSALLGVPDLHEVMARREAYRRLSRIGDHIHRVAERIWYAQVKEA
ncbi:MAG TPA: DUF47 family protein [Acidimicrobiia bacterium]|nr:DUF47 family protein [Acidimicrobiia bacterium]